LIPKLQIIIQTALSTLLGQSNKEIEEGSKHDQIMKALYATFLIADTMSKPSKELFEGLDDYLLISIDSLIAQ